MFFLLGVTGRLFADAVNVAAFFLTNSCTPALGYQREERAGFLYGQRCCSSSDE